MSYRGSKAYHEEQWERAERRDGYQAGLFGAQGGRGNVHYQRGWREGLAARQRVRIKQETRFVAEGAPVEQFHTAYLKGRVVGRWYLDGESNWAFDERGPSMTKYDAWRRALQAGAPKP